MSEKKLEGQIAIITGASRGIGAAIAKLFAAEGAHAVIGYNGSEDRARAVMEEITAEGGSAQICRCDVSDFKACGIFADEIYKKYKRIDILVNNAGITRDGLLMAMSEEDFDAVIDANLKGTFNMTRHVSRRMLKARSGRIINMASVAGVLGNAGQANYAASKAGIIGLTKSAARELASRGITVNAIAPGIVETDMTRVLPDDVKTELLKKVPLGRICSPEEIAQAALFLASSGSAYMTGQVLKVDGGMSM